MSRSPAGFVLDDRPFSPAERRALAPDLEALGVDERLLDLYETTVTVRSRHTRPLLLRAVDGERLLGVAAVTLCRDSGVSFFDDGLLRRAVRSGPPIWYWERVSLGTDGHAGPGVVAEGVRREAFAAAAVRHLARSHLLGVVVDEPAEPCATPHVRWPGMGVSTVAGAVARREQLLREHRNLARKVRRFRARGGTVQRLDGPLPQRLRADLQRGYAQARPLNPPFRELYPAMVDAHWDLAGDRLVHLVAHLGGRPVGYHSYCVTGRRLVLLSGVFDRPDGGTAHAYENVLLDSLDLAAATGCTHVEFGGTVNDVKATLLGRTPTELRFVSRWAPVRAGLARLLPRTRLGGLAQASTVSSTAVRSRPGGTKR